jgi:predicted lactoylglutathione lyase
MLINREFFGGFTDKPVSDARTTTEVLVCLSARSRYEVDALVDRAIAAGGTEGRSEDHGSMYGRSYADLDGHIWEILWMDPSAVQDDATVS